MRESLTEAEKPGDGLLALIKKAMNPKQEEAPKENSDLSETENEASKLAAESIREPHSPRPVEPVDEPEPAFAPVQEITVATSQPRKLTAGELQGLILDALIQIPDAPKRGMAVTVYGYHPWNAMVSFAPGSTRSSTAATIRSALIRVVDEMRSRVDIEMPQD